MAKDACKHQSESKHLHKMLYTTVLSALALAGSAFAGQVALTQQSTTSGAYYGSISFTLRDRTHHVGACGRVCDGAFTCKLDGKVTKCSGGDARIPADVFYRDFDFNDPENSPICKSKVHASGYALQEMSATVCDVGCPSEDSNNRNIEVSERGEHAEGLTNVWILSVPEES